MARTTKSPGKKGSARKATAMVRAKKQGVNQVIPNSVIRRLANHAGVFRLQLNGNKNAEKKRSENHLLSADGGETNMKSYINEYVKNLLGDILSVAVSSTQYRGSKTLQDKDVVGAIKSLGYSFAYDYSFTEQSLKPCHAPKRPVGKPKSPTAPAAAKTETEVKVKAKAKGTKAKGTKAKGTKAKGTKAKGTKGKKGKKLVSPK